VQGQYIFSGSQTNTKPLETTDAANLPVLYHGNHQQITFAINAGEQAPVGFTGAHVFNYPDKDGNRPLASVDSDVFSLLDDLANAMQTGDSSKVEQLSTQLETAHSYVVGLRGQVGVVTQRFEHAADAADAAEVQVKQLLSSDQDVDYASAMSDLSQQQTIYQAALSVTSKLLGMSDLFDLPW
jgi:flagellar hook-associated protein 3 FlgL